MKIIGKTDNRGEEYLAVVSHAEIEKCADKYYSSERLKELKVGDTFDLGTGYNFREDIKRVCSNMESAMKAFTQAQETLMKFAGMVAQLPDQTDKSDAP